MQGEDWRVIKALCYQESLFKHRAVSFAGAEGLCQIMPDTFRFVVERTGMKGVDVFNPRDNIFASVAYLSYLKGQWNEKDRNNWHLWELSFASYNAGLGNILKSQRSCNNASLWVNIKQCLVNVTGKRNSKETINYVSKIEKWYSELEECQPVNIQSFIIRSIGELYSEFYIIYYRLESWLNQGKLKGLRDDEWSKYQVVRVNSSGLKSMYRGFRKKRQRNGKRIKKVYRDFDYSVKQSTTTTEKII